MERFRARASYNNGDHPNNFFHSSSSHLSLPPKPPISPQSSLSRRIHDAEISIFDAERYFNGLGDEYAQDSTSTSTALKKKINSLALNDEGVDVVAVSANVPRDSSASWNSTYSRARSFRATPTSSSEASWNSQTGLLANPPGAVAVRVRAYPRKENKKASFRGGPRSFFGRHCPCYGKKSVAVEDNFSETRSPVRSHCSPNPSQGFPKMDHDVGALSNNSSTVPMMTKFKIRATEPGLLSIPEAHDIGSRNVSSGTGSFSFPVLISPAIPRETELEPARESLEVFRPTEIRRPVDEDDMASDTSSDLFELESFSAHSSAYRRRDSLEELTKFAAAAATAGGAGMLHLIRLGLEEAAEPPSECYAPSEASVEWSVTTAEAGFDRMSVANFSSAASDCGKERSDSITVAAVAGNEGGAAKKRGGGGLLSCRCEKAVSVGPNPVRFGPDQQRLVAGPAMLPSPVPVNRSA